MQNLKFPAKHVDEKLDYAVDYTARLEADEAITATDWEATQDVTVTNAAVGSDGKAVGAWLEGGNGSLSAVTVEATTNKGRILVEKVALQTYR